MTTFAKPRCQIDYFARYNNASLGRVKNLYLKWLRISPLGAMSAECQEVLLLSLQDALSYIFKFS